MNFILKFGGKHARDIGTGEDGHLGGKTAGFEGFITIVTSVAEAVECILIDGLETTMNRFNRRGTGL